MAEIGEKEKIVTVQPKELPVPTPVQLPSTEPATVPAEPELVPA